MKKLIGQAHNSLVFGRRITALAKAIQPQLPSGLILDMGCGSGELGAMITQLRPDITITGVDVLVRAKGMIPVVEYDGLSLPYGANQFAAVMLVDVLHHTDNPALILKECARVSQNAIIIKDHFYENPLEWLLLRGMDWVGNAPYNVRLPYNYFTRQSWKTALTETQLVEQSRQEDVPDLYPQPFHQIIGKRIQFVARLEQST